MKPYLKQLARRVGWMFQGYPLDWLGWLTMYRIGIRLFDWGDRRDE